MNETTLLKDASLDEINEELKSRFGTHSEEILGNSAVYFLTTQTVLHLKERYAELGNKKLPLDEIERYAEVLGKIANCRGLKDYWD